jgi:hypothetical protein
MPEINKILPVLYEANQPYHHYYDNLPLKNILARIGMVNIQVDTHSDLLRGASGTVGSIGARMDTSLEQNGELKKQAIDDALHSIEQHEDTDDFVRMRTDERNKLIGIGQGANKFQIEIEDALPTMGSHITIPPDETPNQAGKLKLKSTNTIFFDFIAPDTLEIHSKFPPDLAHRHHYDLKPAYADSTSAPSFRYFKTTSLNTPFKEGSLRVYVNGVRISDSSTETVHVLDLSDSSGNWVETYIEIQDFKEGTFSLNRPLSVNDVIRIDFDELFLPLLSSSSSSSSNVSSGSSSSSN